MMCVSLLIYYISKIDNPSCLTDKNSFNRSIKLQQIIPLKSLYALVAHELLTATLFTVLILAADPQD